MMKHYEIACSHVRVSVNLHTEFHAKLWFSILASDVGGARREAVKKYAEQAQIPETEVVIPELYEGKTSSRNKVWN